MADPTYKQALGSYMGINDGTIPGTETAATAATNVMVGTVPITPGAGAMTQLTQDPLLQAAISGQQQTAVTGVSAPSPWQSVWGNVPRDSYLQALQKRTGGM
jgi:hypothetical protein